MKNGRSIIERLTEGTDLPGEALPGQPVVEIAGDRRVLIENHYGVREYSCEKISVKVKYGQINICGSCLELRQMTREQLVISGNIECVTLLRRGK